MKLLEKETNKNRKWTGVILNTTVYVFIKLEFIGTILMSPVAKAVIATNVK